LRLDNQGWLGDGKTASVTVTTAATRQLVGVALPSKPRVGALLSSDDYGWRVEPTAKLHPLWRDGGCWPGRCSVVGLWRWWEVQAALLRLDAVWVWEPVGEVALEVVQVRPGGAVADVAVRSDR
jgi:hypothetical protein